MIKVAPPGCCFARPEVCVKGVLKRTVETPVKVTVPFTLEVTPVNVIASSWVPLFGSMVPEPRVPKSASVKATPLISLNDVRISVVSLIAFPEPARIKL